MQDFYFLFTCNSNCRILNPDFNLQKCCGGRCPCPCGPSDEKCPNPELFPAECICDNNVPADRRGLLVGLRTWKSLQNINSWEDCRDGCQNLDPCFYWTYQVDERLCELKKSNTLAGTEFFSDSNFFWGHIADHAEPDLDPKDVTWFGDWFNKLKKDEKLLRYGYLSAVEPKLTLSGTQWENCEASCTANKPPNCHWWLFDKTKMECKFYIKNGVFHPNDGNESLIVGPRHGNLLWTAVFAPTTPGPPTVDRTGARGPPA